MLSRYISIPFAFGLIIALALTLTKSSDYAIWIIPNFLGLAVIYALHPQIDWWWALSHPPPMDEKLEIWIQRNSAIYRSLAPEEKEKFRTRVSLYLMANEFILQGPKEGVGMPDDLKALFAIPLVEMTFQREENWRLKKFERLVFYPNSFPSPNFPSFIHNSELESTDGVIIVALKKALEYFNQPLEHFSLMHYEYGKAFMLSFHGLAFPYASSNWEMIEKMGPWSKKDFEENIIGLPNIDPMGVLICYYFTRSEDLKKNNSDLYEKLEEIFNQKN